MTGDPSDKDISADEKRALLRELLVKKSKKQNQDFPLSQGQRALWFLHKIDADSSSYNVAIAISLRPAVQAAALASAFARVTERHPALRTVCSEISGQPSQRVLAFAAVTVHEVCAAGPDALQDAVLADYRRPFRLDQPLFRVSLFHNADGSDVLLVTVHHLVFDAVSAVVLFGDLRRFYEAEQNGTKPDLPATGASYADYVAWQERLMAGPRADELWRYWRSRLDGPLPLLCFGGTHGTTGVLPISFTPAFASEIRAFARAFQTTLYTVLLAGLQCALHLTLHEDDILIGTPVSDRTQPQWSRTVGYFINMLPLRCSVSSDATFREHLTEARNGVLQALQHQEFPFAAMVERLRLPRNRGAAPILQVMFNLMATGYSAETGTSRLFTADCASERGRFGNSSYSTYPFPQQERQFELVLEMADVEGRLAGNLKHGASVPSETAERIAHSFRAVLESAVGTPGLRIGDLLSQREDLLL